MYDLLVIGAGPAGLAASERAVRLGAKVCLLEARRVGGTDAVSGVVPARTLAQIAHLKRTADELRRFGIEVGTPTLDFGRALERCRGVIEEIHAATTAQAEALGGADRLTVLEAAGAARFVAPQSVLLGDGRVLTADKAVICVGGHPRRPDFPGCELALLPHDLWRPGAVLPSTAVVLGTGHTGIQLASILADFGCKVQLLERGPRILSHEDRDLSRAIHAGFEERGIEIVTGVAGAKAIERDNGKLRFRCAVGEAEHSFRCEAVVVSQGWVPNTAALGLDAAGVALDRRGFVAVDDCLRSSQPSIYAAGDVTGRRMLVTAAMQEGYIAAGNALTGAEAPLRHRIVSSGGYPCPEHGSVGLTEAEARQRHEVEVAMAPYSENHRAIIDGKTEGFCKLIVERQSRLILGAHVVGERAVEVVQLAAAGMTSGLRVEQLAATDLAYPTYVQIVGEAAYRACLALGIDIRETMPPDVPALWPSAEQIERQETPLPEGAPCSL